MPVLRPPGRKPRFTLSKRDGLFEVEGAGPASLVEMTGLESDETRARDARGLTRLGVAGGAEAGRVKPATASASPAWRWSGRSEAGRPRRHL